MTTLIRPRVRAEATTAKLRNVDWALNAAVFALIAIGMVAVYSATQVSAEGSIVSVIKQGGFSAIGAALLGVVALTDYRELRSYLGLALIVTGVVLIAVLTPLGTTINGARAWFVIGPISVQPAEFAKLAVIVAIAAVFTGRGGSVESDRIMTALAVLGGVSLLVLAEKETGSVFVYCAITLGIFMAAGIPARVIFLLFISGFALISVAFQTDIMPQYAQDRFTSFLDADADPRGVAYQQRQAVTTLGSGGLTGQGYLSGPQTQAGFLPEQQTDFILAVWGEETGFAGVAVVLALEGVILLRILRNAQLARDGFGTLLCAGVFAMLLYQVFQNAGMNMKIMPITGITLPFVSYGGSSLLTSLLAIGLVQSVAVHRHRGSPV